LRRHSSKHGEQFPVAPDAKVSKAEIVTTTTALTGVKPTLTLAHL
jgi:hypothetical protein